LAFTAVADLKLRGVGEALGGLVGAGEVGDTAVWREREPSQAGLLQAVPHLLAQLLFVHVSSDGGRYKTLTLLRRRQSYSLSGDSRPTRALRRDWRHRSLLFPSTAPIDHRTRPFVTINYNYTCNVLMF
jgi:hypothetical protein